MAMTAARLMEGRRAAVRVASGLFLQSGRAAAGQFGDLFEMRHCGPGVGGLGEQVEIGLVALVDRRE